MISNKYLFILLAGTGLLVSCKQKTAPAQAPAERVIPVSTVQVGEEPVANTVNYPGTVVALNQTELRAEVNGYVTNIFVADGATVSRGQRLYEIDHIRYKAAKDQAKANLEIAEANLDKIRRDLDRYKKLDEKQAIAKQILDYAETDFNNARAQVAAARANLVTAETNLARSVITAPFNGTLGISQVRQGALVSAGSTLMNTISSTNPIAVDFMVNERDLQAFVELQKKGNSAKDSILSLELPGGNIYSRYGKVTTIDRAVDQTSGTIAVRASFDNPEGLLRVGMNVNARITNRSATPEKVIPYKAVMEQLGESFVYIVTDSNTVQTQKVKLGIKVEDKIVVKEGLTLGTTIVSEGIVNLRPGDKITVQNNAQNAR